VRGAWVFDRPEVPAGGDFTSSSAANWPLRPDLGVAEKQALVEFLKTL
jgi:hypothetical protein